MADFSPDENKRTKLMYNDVAKARWNGDHGEVKSSVLGVEDVIKKIRNTAHSVLDRKR